MYVSLTEQSLRHHVQERQQQAAAANLGVQLARARKWERRAAAASRRARLARESVT